MQDIHSPSLFKQEFPTHPFVLEARNTVRQIFRGQDRRLCLLVGPCSIHDRDSALEFARRLKFLSLEVKNTLFLIMRVFLEKPRTKVGWKGMLYDPKLDGTNDLELGLRLSRELLREISSLGLPCATELLDPLASYYLDDLITWGIIGARTAHSQPHRQMASRLQFPVGFKNDISGGMEPAVHGVHFARFPHRSLGIDHAGKMCITETLGNPFTHLVLRGSDTAVNYDRASIQKASKLLRECDLEPKIAIDCSHGNSRKKAEGQKIAFANAIDQVVAGSDEIIALMLESHLFEGNQPLLENASLLNYGVSVTDSCLSWEDTERLVYLAHEKLSSLPTLTSLIQNGCSQ